jgi:hypothetical protein
MESRGGIFGAQWCAANCRKIFDGKSREIAASLGSDTQVSSLEPLGPRESFGCHCPKRLGFVLASRTANILAAGLPRRDFQAEQIS